MPTGSEREREGRTQRQPHLQLGKYRVYVMLAALQLPLAACTVYVAYLSTQQTIPNAFSVGKRPPYPQVPANLTLANLYVCYFYINMQKPSRRALNAFQLQHFAAKKKLFGQKKLYFLLLESKKQAKQGKANIYPA